MKRTEVTSNVESAATATFSDNSGSLAHPTSAANLSEGSGVKTYPPLEERDDRTQCKLAVDFSEYDGGLVHLEMKRTEVTSNVESAATATFSDNSGSLAHPTSAANLSEGSGDKTYPPLDDKEDGTQCKLAVDFSEDDGGLVHLEMKRTEVGSNVESAATFSDDSGSLAHPTSAANLSEGSGVKTYPPLEDRDDRTQYKLAVYFSEYDGGLVHPELKRTKVGSNVESAASFSDDSGNLAHSTSAVNFPEKSEVKTYPPLDDRDDGTQCKLVVDFSEDDGGLVHPELKRAEVGSNVESAATFSDDVGSCSCICSWDVWRWWWHHPSDIRSRRWRM